MVWRRRWWSLRSLVSLVTAWCLLPPAQLTATTMTSDASAMQQSTASNGQLMAAHCFYLSVSWLVYLQVSLPSCSSACPFRALKTGMQRPLLVCPPHKDYKHSTMVAALGALQALYMVRKNTLVLVQALFTLCT